MEELVEYGKVLKVKKKEYLVEINNAAACNSCALKGGCSVESGRTVLRVPKDGIELEEGDLVELRIPKSRVVRIAFLIYGIPLITFIGLLTMGKLFGLSDISALALATIGLAADFVLVHLYDKKKGKEYVPKILRVLKVKR